MKDLVDEIIAEEFVSPDLELAWLDEDEADPKGLEAVLEGRVKLGAVTLNEMRDALGLDPYTNPAADRPMVLTATGYVPIEAGPTARRPFRQSAGTTSRISGHYRCIAQRRKSGLVQKVLHQLIFAGAQRVDVGAVSKQRMRNDDGCDRCLAADASLN